MPRPHILFSNTGYPSPSTVLDPRYHPLGQPGPRHKGPVFITKVPPGFRLPAFIFGYCFVCWHVRRWLYPHRARTIHNVELPNYTKREVDGEWSDRFRKQSAIHRWGHVYAKMQEGRIREAKKKGLLPDNYPENETQLNKMDKDTFEAMMPKVTKIRFDVGVDRCDGITCVRHQVPPDHGLAK
eukprot:491361_1